jgi:hypothetical protein
LNSLTPGRRKNGSSLTRHAADTDGKVPQRRFPSGENVEVPSRRTVAVRR